MDTGQLRAVLSQSLGNSFAGVYPRDLIPHQLRPYEKAIVVNTDPHDRPGMHWVCLYLNTPIIEYFDSYGLPPLHHEIRDFIARHAQQWDYNRNRYQDYSTDVCVLFTTTPSREHECFRLAFSIPKDVEVIPPSTGSLCS